MSLTKPEKKLSTSLLIDQYQEEIDKAISSIDQIQNELQDLYRKTSDIQQQKAVELRSLESLIISRQGGLDVLTKLTNSPSDDVKE